MPRAPKRNRTDSATSTVKAMVNASLPPLDPPAHAKLRAGDQPFWDGVLKARGRDEWTESDLVVGVQLARCQHDIEREQRKVDAEGSVVQNSRGAAMLNPRVTVLEQLHKRERALLQTLRMGGVIPAVEFNEARGVERSARRARAAAAALVEDNEESLIA